MCRLFSVCEGLGVLMSECVKFRLPCGRVVDVPLIFVDLLPLFGCHDYCPDGFNPVFHDLSHCEVFQRIYVKWLYSGSAGESAGWYDWHVR